MTDTIELPGLGKTKKTTAYALGGIGVLVVGVAWYRSKQQGSAAAAAPAASSSDQNTPTDTSSQDGTGGAGGNYPTGTIIGYDSQGRPIYAPGSSAGSYTTNAAWAQAAEDYLVNTVNGGAHADLVGNALGKYITGQPLTPDQVVIVEQAIAFDGYPPVNGPNGHPPSYITAATPAPTGGGSGSGSGGTPGAKLHAPSGVHVTNTARQSVTLAWSAVSGAIGYRVYESGFGADVGESTGTSAVIHNLSPNHRYTFRINALGSDGRDGPASHTITVTTRK